MSNRRGILAGIAGLIGSPAFAKSAAEMGASLATEAAPAGLIAAAETAGQCLPEFPALRLGPIVDRGLRVLVNAADTEQRIREDLRSYARAGFDPDIAANKSWSPAFKSHVQEERIRDFIKRRNSIQGLLYGRNE